MMDASPIAHWADAQWQKTRAEQQANELLRLRLLLTRWIGWMRQRLGYTPLDNHNGAIVTDAQVRAAALGPDLSAEAEYYRSDASARKLSESIASVESELRERSVAVNAAGKPFPLDWVATSFNLDPLERDVLSLVLATEMDSEFERLCAYAQDDATRRFPTPALATALFASAGRRGDAMLPPSAPLFRFALLQRPPLGDQTVTAARPLRLEERMRWFLQAINETEIEDLVRLRRIPGCALPEEIERTAEAVVSALGNFSGSRPPAVNLISSSDRQAVPLAAAIARKLGKTLYLPAFDPTADPQRAVALLDREAVLRLGVYVFDLDGEENTQPERGADLAESLRAMVVLVGEHPVRLDRPVVSVTIPPSPPASQLALWRQALGGASDAVGETLDQIVHHFRIEPDAIPRVAQLADGAARLRGDAVASDDLWQACRRHGRRRLGGLAERIEPCFGWDDIVLSASVRQQLEEIVAQVRHRSTVYEGWRFGAKLQRGRGMAALFAGPSGTGKTMAAEIMANELKLDLYRIDLSGVVNKYIGETEKNLRRLFDAAEESGAVLFFDEADALFGKRTEVRDSHDRFANIEIDYLLQRMEAYTGLAILATNRKTVLDRAFLRRLRFAVDFPYPAPDSRLRIWQKALPSSAPLDAVDFGTLAQLDLTGGNIQSIALNAAFLAAADGRVITMRHLMHAAAREYAKLDKTPTEAEFGPYPKMVAQ